jgi:DNA-binding transcriptional MerR regulator
MSTNNLNTPSATLTRWEPEPETLYTIDFAAQFAGLPRRHIALYTRYGLIKPVTEPGDGGWYFTAESIRTLRQIEHLRLMHRFGISGVRFVLGLINEIERLRAEMDYPYDY